MQIDIHTTAKSIASIFFAAKIYKALNKHVAKKESYMIDEYSSLEDYLFNDNSFSDIDYNKSKNLIVLDQMNNVLNLAGSQYITESEIVNFKDKTNVITRLDFDINTTDIKQLTYVIAGVPQIVEITGQILSKDITIRQNTVSNEVEVYETKSGNLIARIRLIITDKLKPLVQTIYNKIKKLFSDNTIYKPLAYVIGLIGGFIITPIYNKIKGLFKQKVENVLYFETAIDDNADSNEINKKEINKVNRLTNKIIGFVSRFFKETGKILKPFIQFISALLIESKYIIQNLLLVIAKLFLVLRRIFYTFLVEATELFLSFVVGIDVLTLAGMGIQKLGEKTNKQVLIKIGQALQDIVTRIYNSLNQMIIKEAMLKHYILDLKITFNQAMLILKHNIKKIENLPETIENNKVKIKLKSIVDKSIIEKAIIKPLEKSILALRSTVWISYDNESTGIKLYQQLSKIVNDYISYLIDVIHSTRFLREILQETNTNLKLNKTIDKLLEDINVRILMCTALQNEKNICKVMLTELERIKHQLTKLYVK